MTVDDSKSSVVSIEEPLYQDTSELNRTLSSVPNVISVYLTNSEMRTPHCVYTSRDLCIVIRWVFVLLCILAHPHIHSQKGKMFFKMCGHRKFTKNNPRVNYYVMTE